MDDTIELLMAIICHIVDVLLTTQRLKGARLVCAAARPIHHRWRLMIPAGEFRVRAPEVGRVRHAQAGRARPAKLLLLLHHGRFEGVRVAPAAIDCISGARSELICIAGSGTMSARGIDKERACFLVA